MLTFHFVQAKCIDYLAIPKGIFRFFYAYLIYHLIVLFLLSYVFIVASFSPTVLT